MKGSDEVSTHVLIPSDIADKLRDLSKKTRVTQSEYLREAVLDLLVKYRDGELGAPAGLEGQSAHE